MSLGLRCRSAAPALAAFLLLVAVGAAPAPARRVPFENLAGVFGPTFSPVVHAIGDVDGDGDLDVVVCDDTGEGGELLLCRNDAGDGTSWTASTIAFSSVFDELILVDLDRNQSLDIVGATGGQNLRVFYNLDGSGSSWGSFPGPFGSTALAAGDMNGDGFPDLVSVLDTAGEFSVNVALAQGDGTYSTFAVFGSAAHQQPGLEPAHLALGDLNCDGRLDIVVHARFPEDGDALFALINTGGGSFFPSEIDALGGEQVPGRVAVAQAVPGGRPEVIYALRDLGAATSFLRFASFDPDVNEWNIRDITSTGQPFDFTVGDPDLDGDTDILLALLTLKPSIPVGSLLWLGNDGSGDFGSEAFGVQGPADPTLVSPYHPTVADLTGDGVLDVLVPWATDEVTFPSVLVLASGEDLRRTESFSAPAVVATTALAPEEGVLRDMDCDGTPDIVVPDADAGRLLWFRGRGDGTFEAERVILTADIRQFVLGDFNGDGAPDLAFHDRVTISFSYNQPDPTTQEPRFSTVNELVSLDDIRGLELVDWDGNGLPDILFWERASEDYFVLFNLRDTFAATPFPLGMPGLGIVPGDGLAAGTFRFARDMDFVGTDPAADRVFWVSNPSIAFGPPPPARGSNADVKPVSGLMAAPDSVAVGDLDGDGLLDVIAGTSASGLVAWFRATAHGTFDDAPRPIALGPVGPYLIRTADYDLDGDLDVVFAPEAEANIYLARNKGDGTFEVEQLAPAPAAPVDSLDLADLDGDADPDLFYASSSVANELFVVLNSTGQYRIQNGTSIAPFALDNGQTAALTAFEIAHLGRDLDRNVELTELRVRALRDGGVHAMTPAELGAVFASLALHRDSDDSGTFDAVNDALIAETTDFSTTSAGIVPLFVSGGAGAEARVRFADSPETFFVVATLQPGATGAGVADFRVNVTDSRGIAAVNAGFGTPIIPQGFGPTQGEDVIIGTGVPTISFETAGSSSFEGNLTPVTINVVVEPPVAATYTVTFDVNLNTAEAEDFTLAPPASPFTFTGTSGSFAITPFDDDIHEAGPESLALELTAVSSGNATLGTTVRHNHIIIDNDGPPTIGFTTPPTFDEAVGAVTVRLELSNPTVNTVTFNLAAQGSSTAADPDDYQLGATSGTILPGGTFFEFDVTIVDDALFEGDETIDILVSDVVGAGIADENVSNLVIVDNEPAPVVRFAGAGTFNVDEDALSPAIGRLRIVSTVASAFPIDVTTQVLGASTATIGVDATAPPLTFILPAGDTFHDLNFGVIDDAVYEGDETILVEITSVIGATIGTPNPGTLTINEDEPVPTVDFAGDGGALIEDGTNGEGAFTIGLMLSGPASAPVTVDVATLDITAEGAGVDYALFSSQVTFPALATTANLTGEFTDDALDEDDEQFRVDITTVSGPAGAGTTHPSWTQTILDDDLPPQLSFEVSTDTVSEADGSAGLLVILDAPSGKTVTVDVALAAGTTATAPDDFDLTTPTLTFAPGEVQQPVSFSIAEDALDEPDETIVVELLNPVNATTGAEPPAGDVTILDNDASPTLAFEPTSPVTFPEGDGPTVVTAFLSAPSGFAVNATVVAAGGQAVPGGQDYDLGTTGGGTTRGALGSSVPISFAPGDTVATFVVIPTGDAIDEEDEPFTLLFSAPENATIDPGPDGTFEATIIDDDAQPTVSFAAAADSLIESGTNGEGAFAVAVVLSEPSEKTITVEIEALDGTAQGAAVDYAVTSSTLVFAPLSTQEFVVGEFNDDLLDEDDETFTLNLINPVNVDPGPVTTYVQTILDDDPLPILAFASGSIEVDEDAGLITVPVNLVPPSGRTVTVDVQVTGGSATGGGGDYSIGNGTLTFAAGSAQELLAITINDDALFEFTESIDLALASPANATLATFNTTSFVDILDNDAEPSATFAFDTQSVAEGAGQFDGLVRLSAPAGVTLEYEVVDAGTGTATAGTDYQFATTVVTFDPGSTEAGFDFPILQDADAEGPETVDLSLFPFFGNKLRGAPLDAATVLIVDDDYTIAFEDSFLLVGEADGLQQFAVVLNDIAPADVTVDIAVESFDPLHSLDFGRITGTLVIPAGQSEGTFDLEFYDDTHAELEEYLVLDLLGASFEVVPGTPIPLAVGNRFLDLFILDDDVPPAADGQVFATSAEPELAALTRILGDDAADILGGRGRGAAMGDLNDDGFDDVILGAYGADKPGNTWSVGEVYVVWGGESLPSIPSVDLDTDGAPRGNVLRILGDQTLDEFGYSVATGDLNDDGVDDLIVGAWRKSFGGDSFGGRVYVFHGGRDWPRSGVLDLASPDLDADVEIRAPARRAFLGTALAVGDFDGDGGDDLAVGATQVALDGRGERVGRVYVVWGNSDARPHPLPAVIDLSQPPVVTGRAPARGDVTGLPFFSYLELVGPYAEGRFGASLAVGQLNGDAYDDLVGGLPGVIDLGDGLTASGGVALVAGHPGLAHATRLDVLEDGPPTLFAATHLNTSELDFLAGENVVAGAISLDRLFQEVGWSHRRLAGAGTTAVRFGDLFLPTPSQGQPARGGRAAFDILDDDAIAGQFGSALLMASSNGDGLPELILGGAENGIDAGPLASGAAWVLDALLRGGSGGEERAFAGPFVSELPAWSRLDGATEQERDGTSAAGGGDLNGDGFADIVLTARDFDHPNVAPVVGQVNGNDTGAAFILWGRAPQPQVTRGDLPAPDAYTEALSPAFGEGDIDADVEVRGYAEVVTNSLSLFDLTTTFGLRREPDATFAPSDGATPLPGVWTWGWLAEPGLVRLELEYGPRDIVGLAPSTLAIYQRTQEGTWVPLPSTVDPVNRTVIWEGTGAPADPGPRVQFGLGAQPATTSDHGVIVR